MTKRGRVSAQSGTDTNKKAKVDAALESSRPTDPPVSEQVAAHLVKVHAALALIRNCPIFAGLNSSQPLALNKGGSEHPYAVEDAKVVLATCKPFTAAGNFMWLDHTWLVNHRVPMNRGQIKHLMNTKFPYDAPPKRSPFRTVVALSSAGEDASNVLLQRLSPEELDHAELFSVAKAIESNVGDSVLREWRRLLLSHPMEFVVIPEGGWGRRTLFGSSFGHYTNYTILYYNILVYNMKHNYF